MSGDEGEWVEYFQANGVVLGEYRWRGTSWLVVADALFEQCRLRLGQGDEEGEVTVGIDARLSDTRPGLANYTPRYEDGRPYLTQADVTMADDGLLSVMGRVRWIASGIDMRQGFTVKLPVSFVVPVRKALAILQTARANWPLHEEAQSDGT